MIAKLDTCLLIFWRQMMTSQLMRREWRDGKRMTRSGYIVVLAQNTEMIILQLAPMAEIPSRLPLPHSFTESPLSPALNLFPIPPARRRRP